MAVMDNRKFLFGKGSRSERVLLPICDRWKGIIFFFSAPIGRDEDDDDDDDDAVKHVSVFPGIARRYCAGGRDVR